MKKKTLLITITAIVISLILSINVFATAETLEEYFDRNSGRATTTEEATVEEEKEETKTETETAEETETEPRNLIAEKEDSDLLISENEKSDALISEKEDESLISEKEDSKEKTSKKSSSKFEDKYKKTIDEELYASDGEKYTLEDTKVIGNAFLTATEKVIVKNARINGDLFVISNNIELVNTVVTGNIFACAQKINMDVKTTSIYGVGNELKISDDSIIINDVRLCGNKVKLDGEVGRDKAIEITKEVGEFVVSYDYDIKDYWIDKGFQIAIILVIAIVVLIGSPKFTDVNNQLRLRDFFISFFTGILYIIIISAIAALLLMSVFGIGYAFLLMGFMAVLLGLGKALFILAFAIRISGKPEKISKVKVFFMTAVVAAVVSAIEMLSLAGWVGALIVFIFNLCITLSGFGAIFKVIFTSSRKIKKMMDKNKKAIEYKAAEKKAIKEAKEFEKMKIEEPVAPVAPVAPVKTEKVEEELKEEIKAEVKEEIAELKEEKEIEKKLEENSSDLTEVQTKAEEGPVEDIEEVKVEVDKEEKEVKPKEVKDPKKEKTKNNSSKKKNKK